MKYLLIITFFINGCKDYISRPCSPQEEKENIEKFCKQNNTYSDYEACIKDRKGKVYYCYDKKITTSATINGIAWIPVLIIFLPLFLIVWPIAKIKELNKN